VSDVLIKVENFGKIPHPTATAGAPLRLARERLSVVVPNPFHPRRVNWLFEKMLNKGPNPVEVLVTSTKPVSSASAEWWKSDLIEFQNEAVKFLHCIIKF